MAEIEYSQEQLIGITRLEALGLNVDPVKLKLLSDIHKENPDIKFEHIEPGARLKMQTLRERARGSKGQGTGGDIGVDILVGVSGSSLGNWMIMSALNKDITDEEKSQALVATDVDVFVLIDEKANTSGNPGVKSVEAAEQAVAHIGPPFCETFNPSHYNFDNENFGLEKIAAPPQGSFDMYYKPGSIASTIVARASQVRFLANLYKNDQNPNFQHLEEEFDAYLESVALNIESTIQEGNKQGSKYWYAPDFADKLAAEAGLPIGSTILESFRKIAEKDKPTVSDVKAKHILRAAGNDSELKKRLFDNMDVIKKILKENFGLKIGH